MKIHRIFALWCIAFLILAKPARAEDIAHVWHGIGVQAPDITWAMEVDLSKPVPTVSYPGLNCSGEWRATGEMEYQEIITIGRDRCIDGHVSVSKWGKSIRLGLVYREQKDGKIVAHAVVFPGGTHGERSEHMLGLTRAFARRRLK
jgi:hypothetical protein